MKKKNLLFVVFAVAMLVLCGCSKEKVNNQKDESEDISTQVALTDMDEVVYLKYTDNTTTVTLVNTNGIWYFENDTDTWLDQADIFSILDVASNLVSVDVVDDAGALEEYGLDTPAYTVGLKDAEGNEVMIYIGEADEYGSYYATIGDKEEVYIINGRLVSVLEFDTELLKEDIDEEVYEEEVYEEEISEEEPIIEEEEDIIEEDTSSEPEE